MTLESDVEAIRERVSDTQQLYREVCAIQFFRYGETPTANKLYQLVRKGSMSAPAKALRDFWAELRDKTRLDVGQPDLPPEVAKAAGELVATLWRVSGQAASETLAAERLEARQEVHVANDEVKRTNAAKEAALASAERSAHAASEQSKVAVALQARLVEIQTTNAMLRDQLGLSRNETAGANAALVDARRDFAEQLEKLRAALLQNEQRLVAAERRALLEIEAERAAAAQARKTLSAAIEKNTAQESAHRSERDSLRDDVANLKAQLNNSVARSSEFRASVEAKDKLLAEQISLADTLRRQLEETAEKLTNAQASSSLAHPPRQLHNRNTRARRRQVDFSAKLFITRTDGGN
ncbi:DNA-binding protein [Paraburkholderia sediminicola]|uniref:DNA-binding protein n=1 Tax=Paraburkholderia sediminicola TaxID=458836 RepID=UPI0038B86DB2